MGAKVRKNLFIQDIFPNFVRKLLLTAHIMKKIIAFLVVAMTLFLCANQCCSQGRNYYKTPNRAFESNLHKTKYDYSGLAQEITAGSTGNYQKIRAIYQWICANIDYDTSYSIYDADNCFERRRGVCQAYCELFYRLAKAVGVEVEIISGKAKQADGSIGGIGHAWLFAYTSADRGIFLDPTWGAGSLLNGKFNRRKNCWLWFDVTPEWLILSHFPDDESYQLLSAPLSWQDFVAMPPVNDIWTDYGMDGMELYQMARQHRLELPKVYTGGEGEIEFIDIPRSKSLRIGQFYTFRIKMKSGREFAVWNNKAFSETTEWKHEGDNVYSLSFMPRDTRNVGIALREEGRNYWNNIAVYDVEEPTQDDWKGVEQYYPLSLPEVKNVKNLDEERWNSVGIDARQLLAHIRKGNITELPVIFLGKGQRFTIVSFPMNKHLTKGRPYTFTFRPEVGLQWALVNNNQWFREWQKSDDGTLSMTVTPMSGRLLLYVQLRENDNYWSCMEYDVR
jgi:hypothetical protein